LFGHAGIVGTDHGGSLEWLVLDDEAMGYARRVVRGFEVSEETLAADVVAQVGPGGNFMSEDHTLAHFREEFHISAPIWTRQTFDVWLGKGGESMGDRASRRVDEILATHHVPALDPSLDREIDRIVDHARRSLCG
jgi:trimethylamine--corrinoid protein Co-methyltransferase